MAQLGSKRVLAKFPKGKDLNKTRINWATLCFSKDGWTLACSIFFFLGGGGAFLCTLTLSKFRKMTTRKMENALLISFWPHAWSIIIYNLLNISILHYIHFTGHSLKTGVRWIDSSGENKDGVTEALLLYLDVRGVLNSLRLKGLGLAQ